MRSNLELRIYFTLVCIGGLVLGYYALVSVARTVKIRAYMMQRYRALNEPPRGDRGYVSREELGELPTHIADNYTRSVEEGNTIVIRSFHDLFALVGGSVGLLVTGIVGLIATKPEPRVST